MSMKCNGKYSGFIPVPELLIDRAIPESTCLADIEDRLRCSMCKTRGEVDLREDGNWTPDAPGTGITIATHSSGRGV
jgi:hypothetical protein